MQNPAHIPRSERHEILPDQAGEAVPDPENLRAMEKGAPCNGADRGVHAGRIAAAGEKGDSFHHGANK